MSNATHSVNALDYAFSTKQEIEAYDALPAEIRTRIANAKYTISSKTALSLWRYLKDIKAVLQAIDQIEVSMEKGEIQ